MPSKLVSCEEEDDTSETPSCLHSCASPFPSSPRHCPSSLPLVAHPCPSLLQCPIPQPFRRGSLMDTFPWKPPDGQSGGFVVHGFASRSVGVGVDVAVGVPSRFEFGASCSSGRQTGGHGWEIPGREGDAHGAAIPGSYYEVQVGVSQEGQLDLGLTDITRYSSYSKLWRTLYFVNDAPFRIHNQGFNAAGPLSIT